MRGIRAHLLQFSLALLSVVLGIAFISGTFSLRTMLSATFTDIIDTSITGDAYVRGANQVPGDAQDFDGTTPYNAIPLETASELEALPEVASAVPDITGPVVIVGADGTAVSQGGAPAIAFGFDSTVSQDLGISIVDGTAPDGPHEIALESDSLAASGLQLGDSTSAIIGGDLREVTVVGEVGFDTAAAGAVLTFLDWDTARESYAADGLISSITVFAADGVGPGALTAALNSYLDGAATDANATAITGDEHRAEAVAEVTEMLGFIEVFLLVFAGISLFVGGFIIVNTFAMSVRQRQGEFALLRAIGAGAGHVFASVLIQALVIGLIGAALGIGAGVGLVALLRTVLAQFGMEMSGAIPLTATTVAISLIVGAMVTVGAAFLPARRAALIAPVAAMRESVVEVEKSLRVRGLIGGGFFVIGAGLVATSLLSDDGQRGSLLGYGAVSVVIAMLILAPVLLRPVLRIVMRPLDWLIKPGGKMAGRNLLRNSRRSAATASALMIGMALVGGATVIAASTGASVAGLVEDESNADIIITSATGAIPSGAVKQFEESYLTNATDAFTLGAVSVDENEVAVAGFPLRGSDGTWRFEPIEGDSSSLGGMEVAAHVASAEKYDWHVGDDLELVAASGSHAVRIGAIVDSHGMSGPGLFMPPSLFEEVIPGAKDATHMLFLRAADGVSVEQLRQEVTELAAPFMVLSVMTNEEFADAQVDLVNQVLVLLHGLLALAIMIAILGVANTLVLSLLDRTNEVGLLRAVGMSRTQLMGVITLESLLTAVFGAVLGLTVGVGLAATMPTVFADSGFTSLDIPLPQLGALLLVAVAGGLAAALWPAIRAVRLPVLDAISAP